jgi:hypothetical protein
VLCQDLGHITSRTAESVDGMPPVGVRFCIVLVFVISVITGAASTVQGWQSRADLMNHDVMAQHGTQLRQVWFKSHAGCQPQWGTSRALDVLRAWLEVVWVPLRADEIDHFYMFAADGASQVTQQRMKHDDFERFRQQ